MINVGGLVMRCKKHRQDAIELNNFDMSIVAAFFSEILIAFSRHLLSYNRPWPDVG